MARPSNTPQSCVSAPYGWSANTAPNIRRSGPRFASIAGKLGCTAETLRRWVRQAERDTGQRPGLTTDERQRLKQLERENRRTETRQ